MSMLKAKSVEVEFLGITTQDDEPKQTFFKNMLFIITNMTIEPILILYMLPSTMASVATQNLNLEKACRVNLNLSQQVCDGLSSRNSSIYSEDDEIMVQKLVASMYAWKNIVQSLIPAILLMFAGSWSDRHNRRKPCVLIPIFGEAIASVGFLICTYYFYQLPMEYSILAEAFPPAVTGGWFVLFAGLYSYISDVSTIEMRTTRIGAISALSDASGMVGIALSGIIYLKIGFYGVFSLSLGMYVTGIIYGSIMMKEKVSNNENIKKAGFLKDFFDWAHISETIKAGLKDRERNIKKRIWIIMILVMVIIGPIHATVFSLSFFSKYLKMDDALLGVISTTSKVIASFILAFAPNAKVAYLGATVEMFHGTSFIAMRSIISKLVPPDELGKINSLFGVSEALMPLVYGPMYSMVYKATINVFPGTFFVLGGVLTFPAVVIFFWLYIEHKRDARDLKENEAAKEVLLNKESMIIRSNSI